MDLERSSVPFGGGIVLEWFSCRDCRWSCLSVGGWSRTDDLGV